jgi:hypothetical protein
MQAERSVQIRDASSGRCRRPGLVGRDSGLAVFD